MMFDSLKWIGVVVAVGFSLPILIWTGGVAVPAVAVAAACVVAVVGAAAPISVFWLAVHTGNLQVLNTLHIYKIACNSVSILVLRRAEDDSPDYIPEIGTEAWDALNGRRIDLIHEDICGKLDHAEREELEKLERICQKALDKAFPLPEVDLEGLIRLRDQLRAEGAGHG